MESAAQPNARVLGAAILPGTSATAAKETNKLDANTLSREEALRLYTEGSAWFSTETGKKGAIREGQYADVFVPGADYFSVAQDEIRNLQSILTVVGGKVVHAAGDFAPLAPPPLPAAPDWSPVKRFGGYQHAPSQAVHRAAQASCGCGTSCSVHGHAHGRAYGSRVPASDLAGFWGVLGCSCWA